MGTEVLKALVREPDLQAVGAVDRNPKPNHFHLPENGGEIPYSTELEEILTLTKPQVLVDFSTAEATRKAVPIACRHKVNLVIGTSGLNAEDITHFEHLVSEHGMGAVVAPNFALGAVLLIHLSQIAAMHFDYAEITETHHYQKKDAPSATAIATARAMVEARGRPFDYPPLETENLKGARGGELGGVAIHSLRLPGTMAHQEVLLGAPGQTLSLRHDAISRECYMPGVLLAVRQVVGIKGLCYGLDKLLGL